MLMQWLMERPSLHRPSNRTSAIIVYGWLGTSAVVGGASAKVAVSIARHILKG